MFLNALQHPFESMERFQVAIAKMYVKPCSISSCDIPPLLFPSRVSPLGSHTAGASYYLQANRNCVWWARICHGAKCVSASPLPFSGTGALHLGGLRLHGKGQKGCISTGGGLAITQLSHALSHTLRLQDFFEEGFDVLDRWG